MYFMKYRTEVIRSPTILKLVGLCEILSHGQKIGMNISIIKKLVDKVGLCLKSYFKIVPIYLERLEFELLFDI